MLSRFVLCIGFVSNQITFRAVPQVRSALASAWAPPRPPACRELFALVIDGVRVASCESFGQAFSKACAVGGREAITFIENQSRAGSFSLAFARQLPLGGSLSKLRALGGTIAKMLAFGKGKIKNHRLKVAHRKPPSEREGDRDSGGRSLRD